MKIEMRLDPFRLRTTLTATPGEYDGHPAFADVNVSALPIGTHPDRAAVAAALVFYSSVSGSFTKVPGCSPTVASGIRRWFDPVEVHVTAVDFEPSRIVSGDATLHVLAEGINEGAATPPLAEHDVRFRVSPEGAGFYARRGEFSVISNAALLAERDASPLARLTPVIGIAVLFAEDLFAGAIAVPGILEDDDRELWERLRRLLDSAGLQLTAVEAAVA